MEGEDRRLRRKIVQKQWDEIEKMAIALQSGQLEAFEMMGMVLDGLVGNAAQTDMHMAVLFEVLPVEAQRKMLGDTRLEESLTVLPIINELRNRTRRRPST